MKFREDINGMRAVAVILVLLFHFGAPGFDAGFIGVDVFFVISGFLMTGIIVAGLEQRRFSVLGFYRARIARLYPALLAVVAATLAFGLAFVEPGALEGIARDGIAALLFVSNFVFLKQAGYFGAQADTMWLLHTWSLSVEWQFYLIYPIVLALAFPFLPSRLGRFGLLLAGFVLSLALSTVLGTVFDNDRIISADFYMLPPRAWEMLAGGLVVLWPWRAPAWAPRARSLEIAGILVVFSSLLLFSRETPWPSFTALVPVGGTMLVLAAHAPRSTLAAAPLQRIGAWSYSIYLWHWPLVAAIAYFGVTGPLVAPLACAASLLAGWASYRFIEQPCRVLLKEKAGAARHTRIALMAGLGLVATLALAALIQRRDAGLALPAAAALFYGCYAPDFETGSHARFGEGYLLTTANMRWYWRNYLGAALDAPPPLAAPLHADLAGLPPLYLAAGGLDTLADDTLRLAPQATSPAVAQAPQPTAQAQADAGAEAAGAPVTISQAPLTQSNESVIIRRGDTLWQISRRVYGAGVRYTTIYLANRQQINNPDRIRPGQIFGLPKDARPDSEELHRKRLHGDRL